MSLYRHQYIWLRSTGCVIGIEPEEMISCIEFWNREPMRKYGISFWSWLSEYIGQSVSGFCILWNEDNPHMSKLPIIKEG